MQYNNKFINYANRGMDLEYDINITNEYYREHNIGLVYKKPTPIKITKVSFDKAKINEAFFEAPSTLDYNGVVDGKYIEFDAKETKSKTSFPLSNIHKHQLEHIKKVLFHKGTAFLIVRFTLLNKTYLLLGEDLLAFIKDNDRKSIPLNYFEEKGKNIELKYSPRLDYLRELNYHWR